MKSDFFQAIAVLVLLYNWTTWNLMKHMEKKVVGNYTKIWRAIFI